MISVLFYFLPNILEQNGPEHTFIVFKSSQKVRLWKRDEAKIKKNFMHLREHFILVFINSVRLICAATYWQIKSLELA